VHPWCDYGDEKEVRKLKVGTLKQARATHVVLYKAVEGCLTDMAKRRFAEEVLGIPPDEME
jgi:hypothetical protein